MKVIFSMWGGAGRTTEGNFIVLTSQTRLLGPFSLELPPRSKFPLLHSLGGRGRWPVPWGIITLFWSHIPPLNPPEVTACSQPVNAEYKYACVDIEEATLVAHAVTYSSSNEYVITNYRSPNSVQVAIFCHWDCCSNLISGILISYLAFFQPVLSKVPR